jgi:hypothetical protein
VVRKNDAADAKALWEAVTPRRMPFVPVKSIHPNVSGKWPGHDCSLATAECLSGAASAEYLGKAIDQSIATINHPRMEAS